MKYMFGDMFNYRHANARRLVTTNSFVRQDGKLVMGRGAAYQATKIFPAFAQLAGEMIRERKLHLGIYGVIFPLSYIGLFQVKFNWSDQASIELIENSCNQLSLLAQVDHSTEYHMNYPGIGNGRLSTEQVEPLLSTLPDNVYIWSYKQ